MQKNSHFASISKYHASADGDGIVFNIQRFRLLRGSARVYILTKKTNRKYLIVLVNIFDQRKNSQNVIKANLSRKRFCDLINNSHFWETYFNVKNLNFSTRYPSLYLKPTSWVTKLKGCFFTLMSCRFRFGACNSFDLDK